MNDTEKLAKYKEVADYLIDVFSLGDCIYSVRENADYSDRPEDESSWDHPDVIRFGQMFNLLDELRKL